VHDAGLDDGVRESGPDRFRKALQAVDDGDQDVAEAAGLELVENL
jgi:ABC-type arginine transport system permease subunit